MTGLAHSESSHEITSAVRLPAVPITVEITPSDPHEVEICARNLAPGSDVFVAWLPKADWRALVQTASQLRRVGMNPVPHIAARKLTSEEDVENFLASLRDEAGVTRALVIGGETQAASFVYPSSVSLIETGLLEAGGIRSIGISGYPEPHPYISDHDLVAAMDKKIAYGQAKDLELFIVSQFCFDGNAVVSWLKKLRKRGVTLPVRVGITGPASPRTLLKYALKCGVGSSIRALSTRTKTLTRLLEDNVSESVLRTMAPGADKLGVSGIHLFPFGGLNKAIEWTRKIQTNGM